MFILGQIPFADARPLVSQDTGRLPMPTWPQAEPGKQFVRSVGGVRKRRRGGLDPWPGEEYYCDARRALRFTPPGGPTAFSLDGGAVRLVPAFRRYFSDGTAVVRLEVGLSCRMQLPTPPILDAGDAVTIMGAAAAVPIAVGTSATGQSAPLAQSGPRLAKHLLRCTTAGTIEPVGWWLSSGRPLFLVEYGLAELSSLPHRRQVSSSRLGDAGIDLAHTTVELEGGREVGVWLVGIRRDHDVERLRKLRIHLFRLHAERETVRMIAQLILGEKLDSSTDACQRYLRASFAALRSSNRFGNDQPELLQAAYEFEDLVNPGERATLLKALEDAQVRPQVRKMVEEGTAATPSTPLVRDVAAPLAGAEAGVPQSLSADEEDRLVNLIARQAGAARVDPVVYLRDLVSRAHLPEDWQLELAGGWTGNPMIDSRNLVKWTAAKGVNRGDSTRTTLGSLLEALLPQLGLDDASWVMAVIVTRRLVIDRREREGLRMRHQIPAPLLELPGSGPVGPEIEWLGPENDLELQALLEREPEFVDVGFLSRAIACASSVCRVERPVGKGQGTGFLMGPDLVLTNYHVIMYKATDDFDANAATTVVRFGAITGAGGTEQEGTVLPLAAEPVVAKSPVDSLDYALLRVSESVQATTGAAPLPLGDSSGLDKGMGLHILQHPNGGAMVLGFSYNGLTGVYPNARRVQYATRAAGGSSGSPCFNDDWQVVALHHAARGRFFGSVGEGVMLNYIQDEVARFL
jgi:V8-like Glu-specific endopeptidase